MRDYIYLRLNLNSAPLSANEVRKMLRMAEMRGNIQRSQREQKIFNNWLRLEESGRDYIQCASIGNIPYVAKSFPEKNDSPIIKKLRFM